MGKHSKGIRYLEVSGKGKGKGKRPYRKSAKIRIAPSNTKMTSRNKQAPSSTTGN